MASCSFFRAVSNVAQAAIVIGWLNQQGLVYISAASKGNAMKPLSCEELQRMGGSLLQELLEGHSFLLVHEGTAVAEIQPIVRESPLLTREEAIERLKAFRKKHPLGDLNVRQMIDEGRS